YSMPVQDYIGEARLNSAFQKFMENAAFREKPPFATSNEWYGYIKEVVPDSLKYLAEDGFEKITLYENRVKKAEFKETGKDRYQVKLTVETKKIYYDGLGKETGQGKKADLIEIGIFGPDGKNKHGMTKKTPLYIKKHWLKPGEHILEFEVKGRPVKAGIDPYNKLIDRVPDDNLIPVTAL
ncbi:MAG: peptidase M1, partial [Bacteroidia bacterium]|nr:peptidase M1 [Bacteroidia bacterium]